MKIIFTVVSILCFAITTNAQQQATDSLEGNKVVLDEVFVSAIRVTKATPVTFSNLTKEQIKPRNLGQDIPILMNFLPSVVTTSDAGAGVGYTGIRVRGSDATRVNVTINGIPYNDSESHGTFWVNMPDFASSTESLQLQRGVGSSTNGAGAFGASLNVLTDAVSQDAYAQISSSIGSFKTLRNTLKFSTGLLNDQIEISGRLSQINSDGYIDRATSDLESYFLQAAYKDDNTLIKAILFGGHEVTYQSWNGIDAATLRDDRTFNFSGIYTDENGATQFYDREEDNYKQNHAQLLWNETLNENWKTNLALHYTKGRGYFEQFKEDDDFNTYGFTPINVDEEEVNSTDVIRRRWLDNDFYGTVFSANYRKEKVDLILGGGWNKYNGDHFGEVIWARYASTSNIRDRYYDDNSTKTDFNIFSKLNYNLNDHWSLFGDLQYRTVGYQANGDKTGIVDDTFNFFNPKAGITFDLNLNNNFYFSYAVANREPNRNDYESGDPKPEKLNDFELGWRYVSNTLQLNTNVYYMGYKDQLVLTGDIDDVGDYLRANVPESYRMGLELDLAVKINNKLTVRPNIAVSRNKINDFILDRDNLITNLGDTNIAFSPSVIAGNILTFKPKENLQFSIFSKYVGEQYLSNTDTEASKLNDYFTNDLNAMYEIQLNSFFKSIVFSALVNNIFNEKYESNGYTYLNSWDEVSSFEVQGYYPQAGTNFLVGATLNF
ncbi:TonB-dependent receptor [Cellulophaga sp. L1A9]|uniref:TonB-dependent receptor n=1 Tax=Cellulophaga sp. L1A9 TaxID=2686362 RepID=UPI00131E8054|nr:TonB-dependent receptor [Cellulophaga sp. L1A9]